VQCIMRAPREIDDSLIRIDTSRTIHSLWLGDVESDAQCELLFPAGLPGFEEERRMVPVEIPAQRPLVYLQSVERAEICFVALPVYVIDPAFQLLISDEDRSILDLPGDCDPVIGADVLCLALLMPSGRSVQANTHASIVINLHNRRGVQCVPANGLRSRFRRLEDSGWTTLC
jgi:flagellar assembly factor FliW